MLRFSVLVLLLLPAVAAAAPGPRCVYNECLEDFGIQVRSDGNVYIGDFDEGLYDGFGSIYGRQGEVIEEGYWRHGKLKERAAASDGGDLVAAWKRDSAKVLTLIDPLRAHRQGHDDTEPQLAAKKRRLKAALTALNRKIRNRVLKLEKLRLVRSEQQKSGRAVTYSFPVPTAVEEGTYDDMLEYQEAVSGIFVSDYDMSTRMSPETMSVELVKAHKGKSADSERVAGMVGPLSCKVRTLMYTGTLPERAVITCD